MSAGWASNLPEGFRLAEAGDADALAALVNAAYRGGGGWTTEAGLLEGPRIDAAEVRNLIAAEDSLFLLCLRGDAIIGSVHLKQTDDSAYLGLFVVQPNLQGAGIGKRLMEEAETFTRKEWGSARIWMTVITVRPELMAFYERRGYRRTGRREPFPEGAGAGRALREDLALETLEKDLGAA